MADCYSKTRDLRSKLSMAHTNAVFDVCWTKDDTHILTASGNQTIRLWDIENKKGVRAMTGHAGSVKSICVHPSQSDTLVSGSRDGCVFFWDLRIQSGSLARCPKHMPVTKIKDAHKGVLNVKRRKGYTRSVTSVMYVKDERLVATAGANDGYIPVLEAKLNTLKSGATLVKPDDREKIEMAYTLKTNLWRKRKRMFKDLWDMITEAMPNNLAEFREELGIETDEDAGVKTDDYCNLVVRKPVAKRLKR
ncbi:hypothetical protein R1flu_018895 [Riccia fluitans]|uniref:Leucine zipper with capping helix domain-containing protein n=1 Tax=Riccia fluitans TaxID=41844 RepID=A0ABD1ZI68_9MARC